MKRVTHLYSQFHPIHYVIDLIPSKEDMKFSGSTIISGKKVGRPSQRITLHQKGLKITSAKLIHHTKDGDVQVEIDRINVQVKYDEVRLHSKQTIFPGSYTITLKYKGNITHNMDGIYPCNFKHDGKDKVLIATQFESHHAREVFPCIDEPQAKATFDLSLTTPKDEVVVSNTPIKVQVPVKGQPSLVHTTFQTTPHMSTYLLAFVYGQLEYLEAKTKRGVTVRTYATPNNVSHTKFALETAIKCLDYYSEYFDIDYPLEKCDMIALPDFASGAMENWGCITYRDQTLLVDPDNTSLGMKQYVAMVVAHELTHQWFGNLVTMKWWTDLWLNEGFASWFEYLALDHLFPEWNMWTQYIVDDQLQAFKADALEHTHPVEVEVRHPDEIRTIFDSISYHKGASVIHMLHAYLGPKDFQTGLRYYLKQHSYKNTVTNDLWEAFETASEKPVAKFMHTWVSQSGYPLLNVAVNDTGVHLSQERFVLNPKSNIKDSHSWPIPLLTGKSDLPEIFDHKTLEIKGEKAAARFNGVKLNAESKGFYRTVYNASYYQVLAAQILSGHLSPLDRLNLLSDISEVAKAGKIPVTEALNLLSAYKDEENCAVWDIIAGLLGSVRQIMDDETVREDMKPYVRSLLTKQLKRLGWKIPSKESHFDGLLRPTILGMASAAEEPSVVKEALARFTKLDHKKPNQIEPDLRSIVYGTVARTGGTKEYNKLLALHNSTTSNEEKLNLCAALCNFKQPKLINRTLEHIKSPDVRLQDVSYWIAYSFMNRHAHQITWDWVKHNWQWLQDNLGSDLAFYRMPMYAARGANDEAFLKDYKKFFTSVMSTSIERTYNQGIEVIQWQSAWRKRDLKLVQAFFSNSEAK